MTTGPTLLAVEKFPAVHLNSGDTLSLTYHMSMGAAEITEIQVFGKTSGGSLISTTDHGPSQDEVDEAIASIKTTIARTA